MGSLVQIAIIRFFSQGDSHSKPNKELVSFHDKVGEFVAAISSR